MIQFYKHWFKCYKKEIVMTDQLMSLSKIFSDRLFRIPDYQRGYAWGTKEVNEFWNDLDRLQINKNHYVGVLTLEPVPLEVYNHWIDDTWLIQSKKYSPFYVVDGQQRLTTAILLINSIFDLMLQKDIKKINYTSYEEIIRKFVYESKDENKSRTYIFGYEEKNPSYEYLIRKIYKEKSEHSYIVQETTYTANLANAKKIFMEKLSPLNTQELEIVYTKITQHFLFNIYEISSDIDVFVTFETMNNRGKPLSHLELLKNRLIYLSTLFKIDDSNRARLRRNINECWKDIYHFLGKNKDKQLPDDEFLNAHFQLYFCKKLKEIYKPGYTNYRRLRLSSIQQNYLLDKFFVPQNISDKQLTIEDVFNYIDSLKTSIELWNFINNPSFSCFDEETQEYLRKLNYLSIDRRYYSEVQVSNYKVLILACLENYKNESVLLKFLKSFEKYLFLIDFYTSECFCENDKVFIDVDDLIIKVKSGDISTSDIIERLNKISAYIISSADINKRLIELYGKRGFYPSNFLKYFLCEYEVELMRQSKSGIVKLDRDILFDSGYESLEHIYPQNSHHRYWLEMFSSCNAKEKNSLRSSLGNFVLVSKPKNSKLGNKPFPEKKCNDQNSLGYKYGNYSEIELTNYEDWGANEILDRGLKLLNLLYRRWGIKIGNGNKPERKAFLGLSFMK